jgi:hypothetical protein
MNRPAWATSSECAGEMGSCVRVVERSTAGGGRCGGAAQVRRLSPRDVGDGWDDLPRRRLPLTSWFAAIWYVVNQKQGVSALVLQHVLEFGSYRTAWARVHKLRRAMVLSGRELLSGVVEVMKATSGLGGQALAGVAPRARRSSRSRWRATKCPSACG